MEYEFSERQKLEVIVQKAIEEDFAWFKNEDINFKPKSGFYILDYGREKHTEYNCLCRGLVIEKPKVDSFELFDLIKGFPFVRFFNYQEDRAHSVNFSRSHMVEKLDGTCVSVFFPERDPNKPAWSTRLMLSRHHDDSELKLRSIMTDVDFCLMPLIGKYVNKIQFTEEDVDCTYMFEFIHSESSVLTRYTEEEYGLYSIGARNLRTLNELCEESLNSLAQKLNVGRPQLLEPASDLEQAQKVLELAVANRTMFEGYVFRDISNGNRVKFKDKKYVSTHHNIDNTSRTLVPKIISGEIVEYLSYFPFLGRKVEDLKSKKRKRIDKIIPRIKEHSNSYESRKDLALFLDEFKITGFDKSMILMNFSTKASDDELREIVNVELDKVGMKSARNYLKILDE